MALSDDFKNASVSVTKAFGDVPKRVNYTQPNSGGKTFNEITRQQVEVAPTIVSNIPMFWMGFSIKEADGTILPTDVKTYVPSLYLTLNPRVGDTVEIIETGVIYTVTGKSIDPAEAGHTLHLRGI